MFPQEILYWDNLTVIDPLTEAPTLSNVPARSLKTWVMIGDIPFFTKVQVRRLAVDGHFLDDNGRYMKIGDWVGIQYLGRVIVCLVYDTTPFFSPEGVYQNDYVVALFEGKLP